MIHDMTIAQIEEVLRKINWAQEIINAAQDTTEDVKTADILSGVSFIINSASNDAEKLYRLMQ